MHLLVYTASKEVSASESDEKKENNARECVAISAYLSSRVTNEITLIIIIMIAIQIGVVSKILQLDTALARSFFIV